MGYSFDHDYLNALRDRDPQAEHHLVCSFAPQVARRARKRLRSSELAEDASQETLLRVLVYFRTGKTLRVPASLPGFVKSVSTYVSLEMLRQGCRPPSDAQQVPEPSDSFANPESAVASEEQRQIVQRALEELDPKDARLLRRVFLEDAERDQLCQEMKISQQYLRVMVHRAKRRLKAAVLLTNQPRRAAARPSNEGLATGHHSAVRKSAALSLG